MCVFKYVFQIKKYMKQKKDIIIKIFEDFISNNAKENFHKIDSNYFFEHKLWKWNKKISLKPYLVDAGINPDCIYSSKRGFYKKNISFLKNIINELKNELGKENIYSYKMDSDYEINPIPSLRTKGKFDLTDKYSFPLKKIKLSNIQVSTCRLFGCTWNEILIKTDNEKIIRKKAKNSIEDIVSNFKEYKKKFNIKNDFLISQEELRKNNSSLFKQLYKLDSKLNFKPKNSTNFFNGLVIINYYKRNKDLPNKNHFESISVYKKLKKYIELQDTIKWNNHPDIMQDILLGMYAKGSPIYADKTKNKLEKKVTDHLRHMPGKHSKTEYKNSGILIDELQEIKGIIDSKYNRKKIYNKLRNLLKKTIDTGVNHLSKEYIQENENEFMKDCYKVERIKTNNWGSVLELYGINGDLFLPTRLDISSRGIKFEKLILELFTKYLNITSNEKNLVNKFDFWYKKKDKNIIPDFTFKDFIIDTKFSIGISKKGFYHKQIVNQLQKYSKTKKKIIILTFNQKEESTMINNAKIKIINIKSLEKFMNDIFGLTINQNDLKNIFENINSIKFYRRFNKE